MRLFLISTVFINRKVNEAERGRNCIFDRSDAVTSPTICSLDYCAAGKASEAD